MRSQTALRALRPTGQAHRLCRCHSSSARPMPSKWARQEEQSASSTSSTTPATPARLRFAPSPTGHLHLGGLRTALFNHLLARKWGGKWLLRIEDTDQTRLVPGAVDALRDTLEWAGMDYDEGVGAGGNHGPYTQSERLDMYRHYANELIEKGEAYECFCTVDDLKALKTALYKEGHMHGYDGRCRHLSRDEVQARKREGKKYTVRFKCKTEKETLPADIIFGQAQPMAVSSGADDFIILKSDGWPTYHLASVVDDHLMEISHVLRGEEWLPSVTKHHQLYKAFGWTPPLFGHLPLLVNADGSKLSKRTGDVHVEAYRRKGYEPEAVINFLGLMGWDHHAALEHAEGGALPMHSRSDSNSLYEVFTMPQLIAAFDVPLINHRRSTVDMAKLDFLNKMTIRRKAGRLGKDGNFIAMGKKEAGQANEEGWDALVARYQDGLRNTKVLAGCPLIEDIEYVGKVFDAELPRAVRISDMPMASIFFYLDPQYDCLESKTFLKELLPSVYLENVSAVLDKLENRDKSKPLDEDAVWAVLHEVIADLNIKKKSLLTLPLRHALTARKSGPGVPQIMTVLGAERSIARLKAALVHLRQLVRG